MVKQPRRAPATRKPESQFAAMLERYFGLSQQGTDVRTEFIAGMTTFTLSACSFFMVASRSATEKPMRLKTLPALGFGISVF